MQRDPRAYLWDVQQAGLAIQSFTLGMDGVAYASSPLVQAAVERKFEIIGEALNQLSRQDPALASRIPDVAQIVAFRNQLIHGYAKVSVSTVWGIVQTALPGLLGVVDQLMAEAGKP